MVKEKSSADLQWVNAQIEAYRQVYPRYAQTAQMLQAVLAKASKGLAPLAIIQTRPKSIASFAEKTQRKKGKYRDPLRNMTDLCGGRVITQTQAEVQAVCAFIEKHFEVDRSNSLDVSQRLKPTEFGYRSVHYIVQFKRGVFPTREVPLDIPEELYPSAEYPMKAEIQVRTVLEHAWAGFVHDRVYKGAFALPDKWQRELAVLAGMLEETDQTFSRIQAALQAYSANYGAYLSEAQLRDEIAILETVLTCDPENAELAHRIGKMAMTLGDWDRAIDILTEYAGSNYQPILRDLGVALCKVHASDPSGDAYRQGQAYLRAACAEPHRDPDAWASLAGTWKAIDREETRRCYRKAFELEPSDPYAVSNYLTYEIAYRQDLTAVALMVPAIEAAIERSRNQIEVGMNLPWAYYNLGIFLLLLERPYESLVAYAKALQLSGDTWMLETSFRLLDQLSGLKDSLPGYEWVHRLFQLGRVVKYHQADTLEELKVFTRAEEKPLSLPVVIMAGDCSAESERNLAAYRSLILDAFQGYEGTILSGGTTAGVSGLAGEIQACRPGHIRSIGYLPGTLPGSAVVDERYAEIRRTEATDFSALDVLQYWTDMLASGIEPGQVTLLGVGGGVISGFEYRLALLLGAKVGVIAQSGEAVARLAQDGDWNRCAGLLFLPADALVLRAFVGSGKPELGATERLAVARAVHAAYRDEQSQRLVANDPSLADWERLSNGLRDSNLQQADHVLEKLQQVGCEVFKLEGQEVPAFAFTEEEMETMAAMEHGRWVVERLQGGWSWGEVRDVVHKISPYIVPWTVLSEEIKELDRLAVRRIPKHLAEVGIGIRRSRVR